jgi:hypothetical protein
MYGVGCFMHSRQCVYLQRHDTKVYAGECRTEATAAEATHPPQTT